MYNHFRMEHDPKFEQRADEQQYNLLLTNLFEELIKSLSLGVEDSPQETIHKLQNLLFYLQPFVENNSVFPGESYRSLYKQIKAQVEEIIARVEVKEEEHDIDYYARNTVARACLGEFQGNLQMGDQTFQLKDTDLIILGDESLFDGYVSTDDSMVKRIFRFNWFQYEEEYALRTHFLFEVSTPKETVEGLHLPLEKDYKTFYYAFPSSTVPFDYRLQIFTIAFMMEKKVAETFIKKCQNDPDFLEAFYQHNNTFQGLDTKDGNEINFTGVKRGVADGLVIVLEENIFQLPRFSFTLPPQHSIYKRVPFSKPVGVYDFFTESIIGQ